jgi:hypothetical protein
MATGNQPTETDADPNPRTGDSIEETSRVRQLTEKAATIYEDRVKHFTVELSILWD